MLEHDGPVFTATPTQSLSRLAGMPHLEGMPRCRRLLLHVAVFARRLSRSPHRPQRASVATAGSWTERAYKPIASALLVANDDDPRATGSEHVAIRQMRWAICDPQIENFVAFVRKHKLIGFLGLHSRGIRKASNGGFVAAGLGLAFAFRLDG